MNDRSLAVRVLIPYAIVGAMVVTATVLLGSGTSWRTAAVVASVVSVLSGGIVLTVSLHRLSSDLTAIETLADSAVRAESHDAPELHDGHLLRGLAANILQLGTLMSATEALALEKRILESALESLDAALAIVSSNGDIRYANTAYHEMDSMPHDRADSNAMLGRLVTTARDSGRHVTEMAEVGRPQRSLRLGAAPLEDGQVVISIIDASESNRLSAVRRDFVADASHELKTPIAAIQSSAETLSLALSHDDSAAADKFTKYIVEHATRLGDLVNDLLDLSRIESETLQASRVDLATLVSEQVDLARAPAEIQGVALIVDVQPAAAHGNAKNLAMATRNLIDNAIQSTSSGGSVTVAVTCSGATATVSVADTGRGIPAQDLSRVFERFYRVDHSRSRDVGGTGLGLAIVKHVAESHGGSVTVNSVLGEGSTFTVEIPCTPT